MSHPSTHSVPETGGKLGLLHGAVEKASHLLPAQGPLSVFVHHNTLHALEHLPFEEAVVEASRINHCQPFMPEVWYRQEYRRGRILDRDLIEVVRDETPSGQLIGGVISRRDFRRALLLHELHQLDGPALRWHLSETGALTRFRPEVDRSVRHRLEIETLGWMRARVFEEEQLSGVQNPERALTRSGEDVAVLGLWEVCQAAVGRLSPTPDVSEPPTRHRETLLAAGATDPDTLVQPMLIRLSAAYLDQGQALVTMPERELGFYQCFRRLYSLPVGFMPAFLQGLGAVLRSENVTAEESVLISLEQLGVPPERWEAFIRDTLLSLKGWAGMFYQAEQRPDRLPVAVVPAKLMDYLAVQLILERFAIKFCAAEKGLDVATLITGASRPHRGLSPLARTFQLFQLVQFLGLGAEVVHGWTTEQLDYVFTELEEFNDVGRRRLFHLAYERRFRVVTLDTLALHPRFPERGVPSFQAIFCIDEREESTRRHLEEIAPACETFSAAGFFGVAMYFKPVAEPRPVALCPVVVIPKHLVAEVPNPASQEEAERLGSLRKSLGHMAHGVAVGSQTLAVGSILTSGLGIVSGLPGLFRVLFPHRAGMLGRKFRKRLLPSETRLELESQGQVNEDGLKIGFTCEEMANIVNNVLHDIGLVKNFAPLVLSIGHGSSSLNNPHESAHDCGACGGGRGGPNARAFAMMANHPRVREILATEKGVHIPPETRFVGAYHNTCDDDLDLYDLAMLNEAQVAHLETALKALHEARARDALERCRRFESVPSEVSSRVALAHVEARSEDLAQPRPEYGHATNAVCVVGRRRRTRGLFLDRRAFLQSYDPTVDDEQGTILGRILRAVVPVGSGINLEYYFSFVDNSGYGCGTKLPHNITGLLGVMDGNCSDLRTGLPWQMVEIHEPVRLLAVIECYLPALEAVVAREAEVARLVGNRWLQVARLDPDSQQIFVLHKGAWVEYHPESQSLPVVTSSADWFHHHREHLFFAEIRQPNGKPAEHVTGATL